MSNIWRWGHQLPKGAAVLKHFLSMSNKALLIVVYKSQETPVMTDPENQPSGKQATAIAREAFGRDARFDRHGQRLLSEKEVHRRNGMNTAEQECFWSGFRHF